MPATNPPYAAMSRRKRRWVAVAVSAGLFAISLALPVFYRDDGQYDLLGVAALLMGWLSLHPAWLANPLWLTASILLLLSRHLAAAIVATLAVLLALTALSFISAEIKTGGQSVQALSYGFYVWLASLAGLAGAAWYEKSRQSP